MTLFSFLSNVCPTLLPTIKGTLQRNSSLPLWGLIGGVCEGGVGGQGEHDPGEQGGPADPGAARHLGQVLPEARHQGGVLVGTGRGGPVGGAGKGGWKSR